MLSGRVRVRLARIRCLLEGVRCFRDGLPLPEALCYVPREVVYTSVHQGNSAGPPDSEGPQSSSPLPGDGVWDRPGPGSQAPETPPPRMVVPLAMSEGALVRASGEQYCDGTGAWAKVLQPELGKLGCPSDMEEGWVLLYRPEDHRMAFVPVPLGKSNDGKDNEQSSWKRAVDASYCLQQQGCRPPLAICDSAAVEKMRLAPKGWNLQCDEDLAQFLLSFSKKESENLDNAKLYVKKIDASHKPTKNPVKNITDDDPATYWATDNSEAWLCLHMKPGAIIQKMFLRHLTNDDNRVGQVTVLGGETMDSLKEVNHVAVANDARDVCLLANACVHYPLVKIHLQSSSRFNNIQINTLQMKCSFIPLPPMSLSAFEPPRLALFPRLARFSPDFLCQRSIAIYRFVDLFEEVMPYVLPSWEYSNGSFSDFQSVKNLLALSSERNMFIDSALTRNLPLSTTNTTAHITVDRTAALRHRKNPQADPHYRNSVVAQVYRGLQEYEQKEFLDYRWKSSENQWWSCDFTLEGMNDAGGGQRECLSDMAEELCPSDPYCPVPVPFFLRMLGRSTGGQESCVYVPNPDCHDLYMFTWIGKIMGAALRGANILILCLPALVWKQLVGETVTWSDFRSVDETLVRSLRSLEEAADEAAFAQLFGEELTYATTLSSGRTVELVPGGAGLRVHHGDRLRYARLVQEARLCESRQQVEAIKKGIFSVVPQQTVNLLTWQEMERIVSGEAEITMDVLKRSITSVMDNGEARLKCLFEALSNFSNEDRRLFLRFVTGRSRPPITIQVMQSSSNKSDVLPETSLCSNTLILPNYSSAKVCEEKLHFAMYNCTTVDRDADH